MYSLPAFYSPGYRARYAAFLKTDFPRIPFITDLGLFRKLTSFGEALVAMHLLESPKLERYLTTLIGSSRPEVEKIEYVEGTVWINKERTQGIRGLPQRVWDFHIGGYQVCEKWLKYRKGRRLTDDDIAHFHMIVVALNETIRLMDEIDIVIEESGGWPGAFAVHKN